MAKNNVHKTYIQFEIDTKGIIHKIVEGEFALKELNVGDSIYDFCPFLEVTFDGLKDGESENIDAILLTTSTSEYNVDIEFIMGSPIITVLLIDRSNVYKVVRKLNQERNDLFLAKNKAVRDNNDTDTFFIKDGTTNIKIKTSDVYYIEALGDYIKFHTHEKKITVLSTMKSIEKKLLPYNFIRIHRSYLINLNLVSKIKSNAIEINNKTLPITRFYKPHFLDQLNTL